MFPRPLVRWGEGNQTLPSPIPRRLNCLLLPVWTTQVLDQPVFDTTVELIVSTNNYVLSCMLSSKPWYLARGRYLLPISLSIFHLLIEALPDTTHRTIINTKPAFEQRTRRLSFICTIASLTAGKITLANYMAVFDMCAVLASCVVHDCRRILF